MAATMQQNENTRGTQTTSNGPAVHRPAEERMAADTHMGYVTLDVRNINTMRNFYTKVVGLDVLADNADGVMLGRAGGAPIVALHEDRTLPLRPEGSAGLFHTAILFQSPAHLAAAVVRIARYVPQLYTGSGDHYVSQAFYLDDPEGNGVELYVDRPREEWTWRNGQVLMGTEYVDPQAFVNRHLSEEALGRPDSTTVGHVHLQVGDVATAKAFYVDTLGFDQTMQMGHSALFVSAGGYHHHMAMNTWGTAGAGLRVPSLGLGRVDVVVPTRAEAERIRDAAGKALLSDDGATVTVADPWANTLRFVPAA